MKLSDDEKSKIVQNNKRITDLLNENESILRNAGYNPPWDNYSLNCDEQIKVPNGYIRKVDVFYRKYHLRDICPHDTTRRNIAYALEVSDLINFIVNRVNIWGPVETFFFKLGIVNLVSVLEAIVLEAANSVCCDAGRCGRTNECHYHFSKYQRNNARKAVERLIEVGILDFDEEKATRVQEIIDLRNRIHIQLAKGNELAMNDFNLRLYNEVVILLQEIDEQIYKKAVPHYNCR